MNTSASGVSALCFGFSVAFYICVHGVGFVYVCVGGSKGVGARRNLESHLSWFFFRLQIFFYPFYWPGVCGLGETRWPGDLPYLLPQSGDGKQVTLGAFF